MIHPDAKNFFIGKAYDLKSGKITEEPILYNPSDLTTHAVVTGMTGSGKTGLCIGLLEEAALKGLPAIIIDPKGDLTNLILHFPEMQSKDFEPWIDPDAARLKGKTREEMAQEAAQSWSTSIDEWGLSRDSLKSLKEFGFAVYSPGSAQGIPVNILSSFEAPSIPWEGNEESLRERIASTVTAVLGLVGMNDIDPLRSKEHILLSNIIESVWSSGKGMSLSDLITYVQKPPMERLGAFPMDKFFPAGERFELAMLLNNFLASPSFQVWQQGQPLDVESLLYDNGKPRHSIFYLSHLSENERMFFVTLLFSSIETWMRKQRGTSGLRALVYFDEILGYLPPVANPPSRGVMLRMIKQARAFGVGLVLATQNPVDLDYKALSNIGTWFIGRLQTERDKMRLMDGLETLTGGMDSRTISDIISSLGKRVFLMNNVNRPGPKVFHARQVLNYLAGPLSRDLLQDLNKLAGASFKTAKADGSDDEINMRKKEIPKPDGTSSMRPAIPARVDEFFVPASISLPRAIEATGLDMRVPDDYNALYKPAFIVRADVRYTASKVGINEAKAVTALVEEISAMRPTWEDCVVEGLDKGSFDKQPERDALFASLPDWLSDAKLLKANVDDFSDWLYRNSVLKIWANEGLKLYGSPDETKESFLLKCSKEAEKLMDDEMDKIEDAFKKKRQSIEDKISRQEGEVEYREQRVSQQTFDALGTAGSTIIGMFFGKKRSLGSSITKTRMSSEARSMLSKEKKELEGLKDDLEDLEREFDEKQEEMSAKYREIAEAITEMPYSPKKSDIFVSFYGIAWLPYYFFMDGNYQREVRAFSLGK